MQKGKSRLPNGIKVKSVLDFKKKPAKEVM